MAEIPKIKKTRNEFIEFESQAMPHSWYLVGKEFFDQSNEIWKRRNETFLINRDSNGNTLYAIDEINRTAFLLGGFALENMIKAFLVYENPSWISEGKLSRELKSHNLRRLAEKSKKLPKPRGSSATLEVFGSGIESWARYPCGLSCDRIEQIRHINPILWGNYQKTFTSYRIRLIKLLGKKWIGPHKVEGSFEIIGDF